MCDNFPALTRQVLTSLTDPWQLVDELNMIYTTCLMIYAGLSYSQSTSFRILLASSLIGLSVFITVYYHYLQDPTFHQNAYALLTAFIVFRSMFIMEYTLRPSLRKTEEKHMLEEQKLLPKPPAEYKKHKDGQRRENARDTEILKQMWVFVAFGLTVFLGGFGIWALDIVYCGTLRKWRRSVGLPWGIVLEGHGWW
jgi:dihydroceramidase